MLFWNFCRIILANPSDIWGWSFFDWREVLEFILVFLVYFMYYDFNDIFQSPCSTLLLALFCDPSEILGSPLPCVSAKLSAILISHVNFLETFPRTGSKPVQVLNHFSSYLLSLLLNWEGREYWFIGVWG